MEQIFYLTAIMLYMLYRYPVGAISLEKYIYIWERFILRNYFRQLWGYAKCKIDKAGQKAGNSGRMFLFDSLEAEFLLLEISAFALKAFN